MKFFATLIVLLISVSPVLEAQQRTSGRNIIRGGMVVQAGTSSQQDASEGVDDDASEGVSASEGVDSLGVVAVVVEGVEGASLTVAEGVEDVEDVAVVEESAVDDVAPSVAASTTPQVDILNTTIAASKENGGESVVIRNPYFSDSMSLSKVCWTAALLPGFGQIYNKQYWKLPILYGSLAAGITLFVAENKRYQPLKAEYDELTLSTYERTEQLNELQNSMIRSNTRRQVYLGATIASYIYFLGDAALSYKTNDVSDIKRATTLATICPGAGQIYNKSYWKLPFVVGGFAAMIYVVDWNNRGYKRFSKAYQQLSAYDNDPDAYPDGPEDEFNGRYSTSYMESLRDSYRRNRDLSLIFLAGLYILQIIDAHVDAHFKDYDISDDLSMNIEPAIGYTYSPYKGSDCATFGFNIGFKF